MTDFDDSASIPSNNNFRLAWPLPIPDDGVTLQYTDNIAVIITLENEQGGIYQSYKTVLAL